MSSSASDEDEEQLTLPAPVTDGEDDATVDLLSLRIDRLQSQLRLLEAQREALQVASDDARSKCLTHATTLRIVFVAVPLAYLGLLGILLWLPRGDGVQTAAMVVGMLALVAALGLFYVHPRYWHWPAPPSRGAPPKEAPLSREALPSALAAFREMDTITIVLQ
jgi:hypothetical protein